MNDFPYATCELRAIYDKNQNSIKGRFGKWDVNFCLG